MSSSSNLNPKRVIQDKLISVVAVMALILLAKLYIMTSTDRSTMFKKNTEFHTPITSAYKVI